jgi:hypothetical protein
MVAGDPLRKDKCHRARFYGNAQVRVINVSRRVGEIDVELDGLGENYALQGNNQEANHRPENETAETETRATNQTP